MTSSALRHNSQKPIKCVYQGQPVIEKFSIFATRGIWHHTGDLHLGVVCTPMAAFSEDFTPRPRGFPDGSAEEWKDPQRVPLVMGSEPPARCGQCQDYLNLWHIYRSLSQHRL
jgi:hypothetical protein